MKKRIRFFHKLKDRLFAGAYLAILMLGVAVTFISCKDSPSDTKVSDTEIWRLELEQIDDGTPAQYPRRGTVNMLLRLNRTRQPDPTCEDAENPDVTTFLADVEALSSRLQQATTGSADGSWNCHGFRATVQLKDGTRYELVSDTSLDGFDCLSPDEDCPAGRVQKIDNETSMLPYRWAADARRGHFFLARNENFAWDPIYDTFVDVLVQNERNESAEFYVNVFGYSPGGAHNGLEAVPGPGLVEVEANSSIRVSWMAHSARQGRGLSYPNHPQDPEARTIIILWNHADPPFERRAALTCFLAPDHPRTVQFLIHEDGTLECGTGWLGSILLSVSRRLLYIERGFHQVSDTLTIITVNVDSLRVESSHPNVRPVLPDYTPPVPSRRELLVVAVDHEAPLAEQYLTIRARNGDTGEFNSISVPVFVYKLDVEANPNNVTIPVGQTGTVEEEVFFPKFC